MKRVILTIDLDPSTKPDCAFLDQVMREIGFKPVAQCTEVDSLRTTYHGQVEDMVMIGKVREYVWQTLKLKKLRPTSLHGGEFSDWGAIQWHEPIKPSKPPGTPN